MRTSRTVIVAAGLVVLLVPSPARGETQGRPIARVSIATSGVQGNDASAVPSLSADGRFVAFISSASNLVPGDTNGVVDIFVRDQRTGHTTRVSVASGGGQGNRESLAPQLSADGRFVAFGSYASNLVPGDTNDEHDAFVHDRRTGLTTRVSVTGAGGQANRGSSNPVISDDGRYLSYTSDSDNLIPGDTNGVSDIYVYDRRSRRVTRVSAASDGTQPNRHSFDQVISGDGRYVGYASYASNLVPGDTNGEPDLFLHDRRTGQVTRISVASNGAQVGGDKIVSGISRDGRYILYWSPAAGLVPGDTNETIDAFVYDRRTGRVVRASVASDGGQANDYSYTSGISADGRYVTYLSAATNLTAVDTNGREDVFVHDLRTHQTSRVSVGRHGQQADGASTNSAISADGVHIAIQSDAANLVPGDTNTATDVFTTGRS